jgi:hypothetical protein
VRVVVSVGWSACADTRAGPLGGDDDPGDRVPDEVDDGTDELDEPANSGEAAQR